MSFKIRTSYTSLVHLISEKTDVIYLISENTDIIILTTKMSQTSLVKKRTLSLETQTKTKTN